MEECWKGSVQFKGELEADQCMGLPSMVSAEYLLK
jgi:hypothetical protein